MILTRQQKELLVIKLAYQDKSTRDIAKAARVSLRDIGTIIRRHLGEEEAATAQTDKSLSLNSRALKLLKENTELVDVAISLNMETSEVLDRFNEYLQLSSKDKLMAMYRELGDADIQLLEHLYKELKLHGLDNRNDISHIVQQGEKIKNLDKELYETAGIIGRLNFTKMQREKEVAELMEVLCHIESVVKGKDQDYYQINF